jgi:hypothetical protein
MIQYTYSGANFEMPLLEPVLWWVILSALLLDPSFKGMRHFNLHLPWTLTWSVLAFVATIQWLSSSTWQIGNNDLRFLLEAFGLGLVLYGSTGWKSHSLLRIFAVSMVVSAVFALVLAITGWWLPPFAVTLRKDLLDPLTGPGMFVAVGLFQNSNILAGFLFWPFLFLVTRLCVPHTWKEYAVWIGFVLCATGLIFTLARGVWLGTIAAMIWFVWLSRLPSPRAVANAIAGWALISIVSFFAAWFFAPHEGFFLSLGYRQEFWQSTVDAYFKNPCILLGGYGACPVIHTASIPAIVRDDPHNLYLYMTTHFGIAGTMAILAAFFILIQAGWRRYQTNRLADLPGLRMMWACWLVFPFMAFLDSYFTTLEWRMLFFLMAVLFLRNDGEVSQRPTAQINPSKNTRFGTPGTIRPLHTEEGTDSTVNTSNE